MKVTHKLFLLTFSFIFLSITVSYLTALKKTVLPRSTGFLFNEHFEDRLAQQFLGPNYERYQLCKETCKIACLQALLKNPSIGDFYRITILGACSSGCRERCFRQIQKNI